MAGDFELREKLKDKNKHFYEINREQIEDRATKLEAAKKYRTLLNLGKLSNRGWQPNWSDKVHNIAWLNFDKVTDTAGQTSLTKQVLPVASFTDVGPARQIEKGGSVEADRRQRTLLQPFIDTFYYNSGGQNQGKRMTLAQAAGILDKMPGFSAMLVLARINMKSRISNTLRLFPDLFEIQGNYVKVSLSL